MQPLLTEELDAARKWRSVAVMDTKNGYRVYESLGRFHHEHNAEIAMRATAAVLILCGQVQWFLPGTLLPGDPLQWRLMLAVLFVGSGVALYLFAMRGFRRMLEIDVSNRRIGIARVNSRGHSMTRRSFAMQDVQSMFVRRNTGGQAAALGLRAGHSDGSVLALFGDAEELDELHKQIAHDVRAALGCGPRRVSSRGVYPGVRKTPRPRRNRSSQSEPTNSIAAE